MEAMGEDLPLEELTPRIAPLRLVRVPSDLIS
jgi:hypothetical protein